LNDSNNSEAHIIPNALGGRLKPKGILCRTCNGELGSLADNALFEAFGAWPTLLDLPRDHGSNAPKSVVSESGRNVRVTANGPYTATDVRYDKTALGDGATRFEIDAPNGKIARQKIQQLVKEFPQVDAAEAERNAKEVSLPADERINAAINLHPAALLGGVAAAIWLHSIYATGAAALNWSGIKEYIVQSQQGRGPWRHYVDGLPGLVGPDVPFGHRVLFRSVPSTGQLIAYVEVLGVLRIGGVYGMGIRGAPPVEHFYIYDLDARRDRSSEFHVDAATFDGKDWASFGVPPFELDSLTRHYQDICPAVLGVRYAKRYEPEHVGAPT
jgi:hypothetical protein